MAETLQFGPRASGKTNPRREEAGQEDIPIIEEDKDEEEIDVKKIPF